MVVGDHDHCYRLGWRLRFLLKLAVSNATISKRETTHGNGGWYMKNKNNLFLSLTSISPPPRKVVNSQDYSYKKGPPPSLIFNGPPYDRPPTTGVMITPLFLYVYLYTYVCTHIYITITDMDIWNIVSIPSYSHQSVFRDY